MAGRELHPHHEPLLCELLQVARCNSGRSPVLLHHDPRRNKKQHSQNLGISPISLFSLSLSFPLSFLEVGKEVRRGWWIVREDAGVQEGDLRL
jgi:hypothetical protein